MGMFRDERAVASRHVSVVRATCRLPELSGILYDQYGGLNPRSSASETNDLLLRHGMAVWDQEPFKQLPDVHGWPYISPMAIIARIIS
jgi:hypothetical protein